MDITFTSKLNTRAVGFEDYRIEDDRVVGCLVVEVKLPDPKQCAIIRNVTLPDGSGE